MTGFKWICRHLYDIERQTPERHFIFGAEESFGYLGHTFARDKDGVASIALISEMALWYKTQGKNLMQALDMLYQCFGFSHETLLSLNYQGKEGAEKIARLMGHFRKFHGPELMGLNLQKIEDYQTGEATDLTSQTRETLNFPKSNVLGFYFQMATAFSCVRREPNPKSNFIL